ELFELGNISPPMCRSASCVGRQIVEGLAIGGAPFHGIADATYLSRMPNGRQDPAVSLTHQDEEGRPRMVDVGAKSETERTAVAEGVVRMAAETLELLESGR